jgi:alpha-1,4-digalacturonate transport system permease protein
LVGLFAMFAPILWLVMSSLKTESAISQFPPTFPALQPEDGAGARF